MPYLNAVTWSAARRSRKRSSRASGSGPALKWCRCRGRRLSAEIHKRLQCLHLFILDGTFTSVAGRRIAVAHGRSSTHPPRAVAVLAARCGSLRRLQRLHGEDRTVHPTNAGDAPAGSTTSRSSWRPADGRPDAPVSRPRTRSDAPPPDDVHERGRLPAPVVRVRAVGGDDGGSGIIGTFLGVRSPGTAYVRLHHYMGEINGVFRSWGLPPVERALSPTRLRSGT